MLRRRLSISYEEGKRVFFQKHRPSEGSFKRMPGRVCHLDAVSGWWSPGASPDPGLEKPEAQTSCPAVLKAGEELAALCVGINEMLKSKGN